MTAYTITNNTSFNSIEIKFDGKPSEAVRDALKALRFRWHGVKKVWYGYKTLEETREAIENAENNTRTETKTETVKANKFGVKVGDLFRSSWGYEQTNVDFFQVIALVGDSSVRVRQVNPPCITDEACGPMAANRTYQTSSLDILPPATVTVFIKDQEKGDLKRLKSYAKDGVSEPQFYLSSFANAYYCGSDITQTYESWYA